MHAIMPLMLSSQMTAGHERPAVADSLTLNSHADPQECGGRGAEPDRQHDPKLNTVRAREQEDQGAGHCPVKVSSLKSSASMLRAIRTHLKHNVDAIRSQH